MRHKAKKYLVAHITIRGFRYKILLLQERATMHILVVAATIFEIRPFLDKLLYVSGNNDCLSHYQHHSLRVDVLIPGVGMVPTAYHLGRQLALQRYDLAINAGIAGSFNKSISPGTVVQVVEDCVPELGAEDGDNFLSVFDLGLADPDSHPYKGGRLVNDPAGSGEPCDNEVTRKLRKVKAITSNSVRGNIGSIARIRRITEADLESMEGAAFFFSCLCEKVPCIQIRSISNFIEQRDKSKWNLDLALKNLNSVLWDIVASCPAGD
jgi:futalosine hydrolase